MFHGNNYDLERTTVARTLIICSPVFPRIENCFFSSSFFFLSKEKVSIEENFDNSIIVKIDFVENYTAALRNKSICQRNYLLMIK